MTAENKQLVDVVAIFRIDPAEKYKWNRGYIPLQARNEIIQNRGVIHMEIPLMIVGVPIGTPVEILNLLENFTPLHFFSTWHRTYN